MLTWEFVRQSERGKRVKKRVCCKGKRDKRKDLEAMRKRVCKVKAEKWRSLKERERERKREIKRDRERERETEVERKKVRMNNFRRKVASKVHLKLLFVSKVE